MTHASAHTTEVAETSVMANQLKPKGFMVVALHPGTVTTEM